MTSIKQLSRVRSVLFAPAVRPDHLAKLSGRGADAVVVDCEDATPANAKAEGRENARRFGPQIAASGTQVLVRINAVSSEWFAGDISDALTADLAAVVVPKVEHVDDLDRVADALDAAGHVELGVMAGLETARGVADARHLLEHPRVVAAYFGAEDFVADMGGRRTPGNAEVHHARSASVLAGRLAGVPMIDQVVTDFRNKEAFAAEAAEARDMGYRGKLCIHPGQVELARVAFTPTAAEVERAHRLVAAHRAASETGLAAIDFEGQMVDGPLVAQAQQLIDLGERT
jgi:citrate lyase subunit beta/citryl-CoA lyase